MPEYSSPYRIGDRVTFRSGLNAKLLEGQVAAIRITEAKMFYDVLSSYYGRVYEQVDSYDVFSIPLPSGFRGKTE